MNFSTQLVFSTCLLATILNIFAVEGASTGGTDTDTNDRVKRRSYVNSWPSTSRMNSLTLFDASNMYRAAPYKVPRPYYIPIYGAPGRPVMFFPPQPLYVNPGMPQDNPQLPSYQGSSYLPPKESPHLATNGGSTPPKEGSVIIRGGTDDDYSDQVVFIDQDDPNAPVWANSGSAASDGGVVQMPLAGDQTKESGPVPTRAPMVRPNQPPLVHNVPQSSSQSGSAAASSITRPTARPQTRPPGTLRTTTTASPPSATGPSNCVWAIISCCSATNPASNALQNCFEQRGCPGPFWGPSPCESDYARAAIAAAVNYYNTRSSFGK